MPGLLSQKIAHRHSALLEMMHSLIVKVLEILERVCTGLVQGCTLLIVIVLGDVVAMAGRQLLLAFTQFLLADGQELLAFHQQESGGVKLLLEIVSLLLCMLQCLGGCREDACLICRRPQHASTRSPNIRVGP